MKNLTIAEVMKEYTEIRILEEQAIIIQNLACDMMETEKYSALRVAGEMMKDSFKNRLETLLKDIDVTVQELEEMIEVYK